MTDQQEQLLREALPHIQFVSHEPLASHTYMRVGGDARLYSRIQSADDCFQVVSFCIKNKIPYVMLGGGSNVLVSDGGIDAVVLQYLSSTIQVKGSEVYAEAGVSVNVLVRATIDAGLGGLAEFMGLPGTVGGAIVNNSHSASKTLIGEHVYSVDVCGEDGVRKTYLKQDLEFAYDYSRFHRTKEVVLGVTFHLQFEDPQTLQQKAVAAVEKRNTTQPIGIPSSGCMFRNVAQKDGTLVSAGYLIDQAGLKGFRIGDAMVSEKHANFIVNLGHATQHDVDAVATHVEVEIAKRYNLKLEREVFSL